MPKCPPEFYPIVRLARRLVTGIWVGALLTIVFALIEKFLDPVTVFFFDRSGLSTEDALNASHDLVYQMRQYAGIVVIACLLLGLLLHMTYVTWAHCCVQNLQKWGLTSDKSFASLVNFALAIPVISLLAAVLYFPPFDFLTRKKSVSLSGNPRAVRSVVARSLIFPFVFVFNLVFGSLIVPPRYYIATGNFPTSSDLLMLIAVSLPYFIGIIVLIAWAWSSLIRHITRLQMERYIELLQESTNACPKCGEFVHPSFPRCLVCGHPLTVPD